MPGWACAVRKAKSGLAIKKINTGREHRITHGTGSENCQIMLNEVMNWMITKELVSIDTKITIRCGRTLFQALDGKEILLSVITDSFAIVQFITSLNII